MNATNDPPAGGQSTGRVRTTIAVACYVLLMGGVTFAYLTMGRTSQHEAGNIALSKPAKDRTADISPVRPRATIDHIESNANHGEGIDQKAIILRANRETQQRISDTLDAIANIPSKIHRMENRDRQLDLQLSSDVNGVYGRWVRYSIENSGTGGPQFSASFAINLRLKATQGLFQSYQEKLIAMEEQLLRASPGALPANYAASCSHLCSSINESLVQADPLKKYGNDLGMLLTDAEAIPSLPAHGITAPQRLALDGIRRVFWSYCLAPTGVDAGDFPSHPQPFFPLCRSFVEQLLYAEHEAERKYRQDVVQQFQAIIGAYVERGFAEQPRDSPLDLFDDGGSSPADEHTRARVYVLSVILREYPSAFISVQQAVAAKQRFPEAPYFATADEYTSIDIDRFINSIRNGR